LSKSALFEELKNDHFFQLLNEEHPLSQGLMVPETSIEELDNVKTRTRQIGEVQAIVSGMTNRQSNNSESSSRPSIIFPSPLLSFSFHDAHIRLSHQYCSQGTQI
jgi:hypothetical protein